MNEMQKMTPLMQQYWDVKSAHEDKIVLFRMGDFFEMFHRDAETAAPVLGIALTSRNKKAVDEIPMCGVPHHSIAGSINKLLQNGFKVAICDQVEDPKFAKGIVKRAVTRILSPGVVYDPETVDSLKANYLASYDDSSVSFIDTTTGEAFFFYVQNPSRRRRLLRSLQPVEVVIAGADREEFASYLQTTTDFQPHLSTHDSVDEGKNLPLSALRLRSYAVVMQGPSILQTLSPFEQRELVDRMELPPTVIRHLEIFETYKGEQKGTLFHAICRAKTSSGARLLKQWLQFPLANPKAIDARLERVAFWYERPEMSKNIRASLASLGDIQRRLGKIGNPSCNPRDVLVLGESLRAGLEVSAQAADVPWDMSLLQLANQISSEIENTLVEEPPVQLKNGGVIRKGLNPKLDELIDLSTNSHQLIMDLEQREKEATAIPSLKIRFNSVFGYYIEITNSHKDKVPSQRYERKQTLANAERYLTKELAELENKVLSAQAKRLELEKTLFDDLVQRILLHTRELLRLAQGWSECDVVTGLAWLALEQNYVRPRFFAGGGLRLLGSRHPVIEQSLPLPFVANDIELAKHGCLLLTGPNMAGKSTLMRQVAVTSILAQCGSFVPAREATLPLFDRIFTRIGASDFLAEGLSTFMVEMKETAEMLAHASENSLVILDEVGRGTSTFDGMSLAQAILEDLLDTRRSMTLFATHYHEITRLEESHPQLKNAHMAIHAKASGDITFLHQLVQGPAHKSYGIHVARLAGLPGSVTKRATFLLKRLESRDGGEGLAGRQTPQLSLLTAIEAEDAHVAHFDEKLDARGEVLAEADSAAVPGQQNTALLDPRLEATLADIRGTDLMRLTPLEALNQIAKWQQNLS